MFRIYPFSPSLSPPCRSKGIVQGNLSANLRPLQGFRAQFELFSENVPKHFEQCQHSAKNASSTDQFQKEATTAPMHSSKTWQAFRIIYLFPVAEVAPTLKHNFLGARRCVKTLDISRLESKETKIPCLGAFCRSRQPLPSSLLRTGGLIVFDGSKVCRRLVSCSLFPENSPYRHFKSKPQPEESATVCRLGEAGRP